MLTPLSSGNKGGTDSFWLLRKTGKSRFLSPSCFLCSLFPCAVCPPADRGSPGDSRGDLNIPDNSLPASLNASAEGSRDFSHGEAQLPSFGLCAHSKASACVRRDEGDRRGAWGCQEA